MNLLAPITNVVLILVGFVLYTLKDMAFALAAVAAVLLATYGFYDEFMPWAVALLR